MIGAKRWVELSFFRLVPVQPSPKASRRCSGQPARSPRVRRVALDLVEAEGGRPEARFRAITAAAVNGR